MKKGVIVLSLCLLLSGCNEKKLDCEKTSQYWEGVDVHESYEIKYSGKDIEHIDYEKELKVSGEMLNNIDVLENSYVSDFKRNASANLIVESKTEKDEIDIEVDANYSKLSDEAKEAFIEIDGKLSLSDLKVSLEKEGYTCK